MSMTPKTAPYGSWKSPISSDLIVQSIGLTEVRFDGEAVYWLEARPQEQGRNWHRIGAVQRAHARARIWWWRLDDSGWGSLLLEFLRQPPVPARCRRERANAAYVGTARAGSPLAVRRRHH